MKTKHNNIFSLPLGRGGVGLLLLCTLFVACNKWDNSFAVNGDCKIESLMLDTYTGVVDHAARTVVVGVPENHDDQLMTITQLELI